LPHEPKNIKASDSRRESTAARSAPLAGPPPVEKAWPLAGPKAFCQRNAPRRLPGRISASANRTGHTSTVGATPIVSISRPNFEISSVHKQRFSGRLLSKFNRVPQLDPAAPTTSACKCVKFFEATDAIKALPVAHPTVTVRHRSTWSPPRQEQA
jgi:hypothetical protein